MLKLPPWISKLTARPGRAGFLGRLTAALFGAALLTDLSAQTVQLTSSAYTVDENEGLIRIAVRRMDTPNTAFTVNIAAVSAGGANGAIDGQDFVARTAVLTFGANVLQQFFDVVILDNAVTNSAKLFNVQLSNPSGAARLGSPSQAQVQILDDESGIKGNTAGVLNFSAATYTVTDYEETVRAANSRSPQGALITVVRTGGNRGKITVDYTTAGGNATPGKQYLPISGTLELADYQMSTNFLVPIVQYASIFSDILGDSACWQTNGAGGLTNICGSAGVVNPFATFATNQNGCDNFLFYTNGTPLFLGTQISATWNVNLQLSNPKLDDAEDHSLVPPTLGSRNTALLGIVFTDSIQDPDGNPLLVGTGMSLERRHYRTAEGGIGRTSFYQMWVNRDPCPLSCTVRYVVNTTDLNPIGGNHLSRTFPTEAGSEYAHPFVDYIPPGTREWNIARGINPPDPATDGIITWSPVEIAPKPLTIPIVNDDRVEFNEDLLVQLFQRVGDPGMLAAPAAPPFAAAPIQALLTIMFDDFRFINNDDIFHYSFDTNGVFGVEHPAGSVDIRYNMVGQSDTDPAFNITPGANASVLATAVQSDGRLILGGEFTAVNTKPRRHIARMTRDGQIDNTFNVGQGTDAAVTAIELQSDGKVIIGGLFSSYTGAARNGLARLNADGSLDAAFNPGLGANAPIRALRLQADGKLLIGGEFTSFNGTNVNYFARVNQNGSLDTTFDTGSGPNDFIYSIDVSGKPMIIEFNSLLTDQQQERSDTYDTGANEGTIVLDFNFGNSPDNIRIYYGNQLLVDTLRVTGQGTRTVSYGPGPVNQTAIRIAVNEGNPGVHDSVGTWDYRLTVLPRLDDHPVLGGRFTSYNGVNRNRLARILPNGPLDTSFNPGLGIESGIVYALAKRGNKTIMGGVFSTFDRLSRNNIAQVNPDGSVDASFDPGSGFNDIVYSLFVQPSGKTVLGGLFTEFNTSRRIGLARVDHDGKLDTGFMDTAYNQFAGIPNDFTWMPENSVNALTGLRVSNNYSTSITVTNTDGTVTNLDFNFTRTEDQLFIGGSFQRVGGGTTRDIMWPQQNFARIWGNTTEGPGKLGFNFDAYSADENSPSVFVQINRDDGHLAPLTGKFFTSDLQQGPGAATDQKDYLFTQQTPIYPSGRTIANFSRMISESYRGNNNDPRHVTHEEPGNNLSGTNDVAGSVPNARLFVTIKDDNEQEGDEQFQLNLEVLPSIFALGGEPIPTWPALGRSIARMTIVDNDFNPGVVGFEKPQYYVDENAHTATITLTRTNGVNGQVAIDYRTLTGGSATPNPNGDYTPISIGTVRFSAGQTNASFTVSITDDSVAELDETVLLQLLNAQGGATLDPTRAAATLTILDNDFAPGRLSFALATNTVNEGDGAVTIAIQRLGGSQGSEEVRVSTVDDTAHAGLDYVGVTNLILRWGNGITTNQIVTIPILDRNVIDGTRRFRLVLSDPLVSNQSNSNALGNQKEMVVNIVDNDAFGNLRFSQDSYTVDENGTNATITVVRVNGVTGEIAVNYTATPELAIAGEDFTPVSGTLLFTNGQTSASFLVPILDDNVVDGTKTVILALAGQTNDPAGAAIAGTLGQPSQVTLSIIDNELENIPAGSLDVTFVAEGANEFIYTVSPQSDGKLLIGGDFTAVNSVLRNRLARLNPDGTLDPTFFAGAGPNNSVRSLLAQPDGRILIAGSFTNVAGTNRNGIARLVQDGAVDQTFETGSGADNPVLTMLLQSDGRIIIGGDFSAYGPSSRNGVARLNTNGVIDVSFNPGTGGSGDPAFTVYGLAQQLDGKILVAGDFTRFNDQPANHLVRLKPDGSVDTNFNMTIGANGSIRAVVVQPDGRILIGGLFTQVQGVAANRIARLNPNGTLDTDFNAATGIDPAKRGANGAVAALAVQIDGKIVVGGDFTEFNGVTRHGLTRLESNGRNDPTINFGTGANGSVASLVVQPDRKIVIAGGFTEYDGQPRLRLARINGGSIKGAGRLEFVNSSYIVSETATNAIITVRRVGGTASSVRVHYQTQDDASAPADARAVPGVDYQSTSGDLVFPEGETQGTFKVRVFDDATVEGEKVFEVALSNPVGEPGGDQPALGDQPSARVVETSEDSEVSFQVSSFTVGESIPSAAASITIVRTGAISVPISVTFSTSDGTAQSGVDYVGVTNVIQFAVGESQRIVSVPIISDSAVEGNETVNLTLSNLSAGGVLKPGGASATLTIVDDDRAPGEIQFQRPTYSIREGNVFAEIPVIRTNGLNGVITVEYATSAGTATPDQDYTDVRGILTFNEGIDLQVIKVPISDDDFIENNEIINLALSNVRGGATLGLANATLTIIDDDLGSGSMDTGFNPGTGANGAVRAIELDSSRRFVIGGDFTAFNNDTNRSRIARLLQGGSLDSAFKTNNRPNNSIASLALYPSPDGRIVIGGSFNTVQSEIENRVARLDADGGLDTSFRLPLGLNGQVSSIVIQPDGRVVIGGVFDQASAAARNHIARLNVNGTVDIGFDPGSGTDRNVNVVALQSDGKVLIGGEFNVVNGVGAGRLARLNANGSVDTTFRVGVGFSRADARPAVVYDIVVLPGNRILVAGDFTAYKGVPRAGIAILNAVGDLDTSFASALSSVNGAIRAVAVQNTDRNSDGKILIGGDFTAVDGTPRPRLARLDASGKFDPTFDPGDGANDSVLGIVVQPWDGRVVVVGAFTEFNNNPSFRGIARLNNDKAFLPVTGLEIRVVSVTLLGSDLTISFTGESGVNYMIEGTSDFQTWNNVKSVTGNGGNTTVTIPVSAVFQFYRVRQM